MLNPKKFERLSIFEILKIFGILEKSRIFTNLNNLTISINSIFHYKLLKKQMDDNLIINLIPFTNNRII